MISNIWSLATRHSVGGAVCLNFMWVDARRHNRIIARDS
jgi:hypothetical protein